MTDLQTEVLPDPVDVPSMPPVPTSTSVGSAGTRPDHADRPAGGGLTRPRLLGFLVYVGFLVGALLITVAYNRAAVSTGNSHYTLFWAGMITGVTPAALVAVSRHSSRATRIGLLVGVAILTFLPKFLLSIHGPIYSDEDAHFRELEDTIRSGHLFQPNSLVGIAQHFPGLEAATTAIHSLSGLDPWQSALALLLVAHCLTPLLLYLLAERLGIRPVGAALAAVLYMANPSYMFFDAQYAYESLGIALVLATLLCQVALLRARAPREALGFAVLGCLTGAATVVTHHLSAIALLAFMVVIAVFLWPRQHRERPRGRRDGRTPTAGHSGGTKTPLHDLDPFGPDGPLALLGAVVPSATTEDGVNGGRGTAGRWKTRAPARAVPSVDAILAPTPSPAAGPIPTGTPLPSSVPISTARSVPISTEAPTPPVPPADSDADRRQGPFRLVRRSVVAQISWVLAALVGWLTFEARDTYSHLAPFLNGGLSQVGAATGVVGSSSTSSVRRTLLTASTLPSYETLAIRAFPVVAAVVCGVAGFHWLRHKRVPPTLWPVFVLALLYFVSLPLDLTVAGASGAHRSWSFSFIFLALAMGFGLQCLIEYSFRSHVWIRRAGSILIGVAVLTMFAGNISANTNADARFGGPYLWGTESREPTPETAALAQWFNTSVPFGTTVMVDHFTGIFLYSHSGVQVPVPGYTLAVNFYYSARPIPMSVWNDALRQGYQYIVVDKRFGQHFGVWNSPFTASLRYVLPQPGALTRFQSYPWTPLVYSSTDYAVYRIDASTLHTKGTA